MFPPLESMDTAPVDSVTAPVNVIPSKLDQLTIECCCASDTCCGIPVGECDIGIEPSGSSGTGGTDAGACPEGAHESHKSGGVDGDGGACAVTDCRHGPGEGSGSGGSTSGNCQVLAGSGQRAGEQDVSTIGIDGDGTCGQCDSAGECNSVKAGPVETIERC